MYGSLRGPGDLRQPGKGDGQCLGALLPHALGLDSEVELLGQGSTRKRHVHPACLGERDRQVLDEVLDLEAWLQVAAQQPRTVVGKGPRPRRASLDRLQSLFEI